MESVDTVVEPEFSVIRLPVRTRRLVLVIFITLAVFVSVWYFDNFVASLIVTMVLGRELIVHWVPNWMFRCGHCGGWMRHIYFLPPRLKCTKCKWTIKVEYN